MLIRKPHPSKRRISQQHIPQRRSFRLRIALLSSALAGTALIGFGVTAWFLIREANLQHLEEAIETQLFKAAGLPRPEKEAYWKDYENRLLNIFNAKKKEWIALRVIKSDSVLVYQSPFWPLGLTIPPPKVFPSQPFVGTTPNVGSERDSPLRLPPLNPHERPKSFSYHTTTDRWQVGIFHTYHRQVVIAINLKILGYTLDPIRNTGLIAISAILLLVALAAWFLAGVALRPLDRFDASIRRVTAQGLDQRISEKEVDLEFAAPIQAFNQMLDRLERSFQQASRFSGDAAHELKTPLAILQGQLEREIQQAEPGSRLQQHLGDMLEEVSRLSNILRKLLLLSLADAGRMHLTFSEVSLSPLFNEMIEDIDLLAPDLKVDVNVEPNLKIEADPDLLRQVLQNLVTNAVKYNLPGGWIKIETKSRPNQVIVTITNQSQDLTDEVRDRLFERFYRADLAHTRQTQGVGLGLSLAREIVRSHQGELRLAAAQSGEIGIILVLPKKQFVS
jgi:two-component system, OmpR family, heavy metal sensor histidine kinase CusS